MLGKFRNLCQLLKHKAEGKTAFQKWLKTAWITPALWCRTNCQDAGDQFGELQYLDISLQRTSQTNSGMQAVCRVPHWGKKGKTNDAFQSLFEKASTIVVDLSATNQATTQVSDWCFLHSLQSISAKWSTDTVETGENPAYWKNWFCGRWISRKSPDRVQALLPIQSQDRTCRNTGFAAEFKIVVYYNIHLLWIRKALYCAEQVDDLAAFRNI